LHQRCALARDLESILRVRLNKIVFQHIGHFRTCGRRWTCVLLGITSAILARKDRVMKLHANAQTCSHCRCLIVSRVLDGQMASSVARDFRVSTKTVLKWVARFRAEGQGGLDDRSSRPHRIARRHLQPGKPLSDAVFALLHTPPRDSGFNRTTWRLADLHSALKARGVLTTRNNLSAVIKEAGYQW
jgi:transposase